jgi:hypothetical protein
MTVMSDAYDLLDDLNLAGVSLRLHPDRPGHLEASRDGLTEALAARIRDLKPHLLVALRPIDPVEVADGDAFDTLPDAVRVRAMIAAARVLNCPRRRPGEETP